MTKDDLRALGLEQLGMDERSQRVYGLYALIKKTPLDDGTTEITVKKDRSFLVSTFRVETSIIGNAAVGDLMRVEEYFHPTPHSSPPTP